MAQEYLIIYDIADGKRLNRVARTLSDYGVRVQDSVFEVRLDEADLLVVTNRLLSLIDEKDDGIKIFPLCNRCWNAKTDIGNPGHLHDSQEWLLV